ncbi:hypothetical protein [Haladaptatus sp. CMAA 1911]|uniref:hypothetical protein n=1 Tax=unclassified Haladaptatus TaxID=2622732 RepID=UPI0037548ACF
MRRVTLLLVVVSVVLAGCAGVSNQLDAGDGSDSGSSGGDGSGAGDAGTTQDDVFLPFAFERPGTYTYETYEMDDGTGKIVWDIQSVEGENITMRSTFTHDGKTRERTATFTREEAMVQVAFLPGGEYATMTMFSPSMNGVYGNDFRVGNTWTVPSSDGTMTYEITGKKTYAGIGCYNSEIRINGSVFTDACYSPDHGTAMYGVVYDDDGTKVREMKLVSYEAK